MESFERRFNNPAENENKEDDSPKFIVPETEVSEWFSKSGGPGGQNVNKRSTESGVRWNVFSSKEFTPEEKEKIREFCKNNINKKGDLIVRAREERSQFQNRKRAFEKLNNLVAAALMPKRERIATEPTPASKERRLKEKKRISEKKKWRAWKETI